MTGCYKTDQLCRLTSMEARRPSRDGDEGGKGGQKRETSKQAQPRSPKLPWTAARTTACYGSVCPALQVTTAPCNCCPNCYAEQSHKDNVRSSAVGKPLKQKKSNSLVQHHLPALDFFWANFFMRVQLTFLLLILPGL